MDSRRAKNKAPRRVPFPEAKPLLLAAAGAGQIFRADGSAVGVQSAAPAVQGLARGGRNSRRRWCVRQALQHDVLRVLLGDNNLHDGLSLAVCVGGDGMYV